MIYDCIIVGAGASGLFCGAAFPGSTDLPGSAGISDSADGAGSQPPADAKINGLILEGTGRAGTKLLMSGAGQCNITHDGSIKDFISRYGPGGSKIRTILYKYNNLHLMDFLHSSGIPTVIREDGKVFPASMKAKDIRDMLVQRAARNGFRLEYNARVHGITSLAESAAQPDQSKQPGQPEKPGQPEQSERQKQAECPEQPGQYAASLSGQTPPLWQVDTAKGPFLCRNLIIAAGGCTYPQTGSDGAMFEILQRDLHIAITEPRPALTPVNVEQYPYKDLSGIAFQEAGLMVLRGTDHKKTVRATGPLLLTHENFSGPLILNSSKDITKNDKIMLNYLYPCDKNQVLDKINTASKNSKSSLSNLICKEFNLPKSFVSAIIKDTGEKPKAIAARLTEDTFTVKSLGGCQKAMVTAGGVALSAIDTKTMEVKSLPGLYIIGEALDIDGQTGGYNLQFAYSSACAAGAAVISRFIRLHN